MTDYNELTKEYTRTEAILRERVAALRKELPLCPPNEERDRVQRRLTTMQEELYDVMLVRLELLRRRDEEEARAAC